MFTISTSFQVGHLTVKRRKQSWLAEEKFRAVELVLLKRGTLATVAAANSISTDTLLDWIEKSRKGAVLGLHRWYKDTDRQKLEEKAEYYKEQFCKSQEAGSELWGDYLQLVRG